MAVPEKVRTFAPAKRKRGFKTPPEVQKAVKAGVETLNLVKVGLQILPVREKSVTLHSLSERKHREL